MEQNVFLTLLSQIFIVNCTALDCTFTSGRKLNDLGPGNEEDQFITLEIELITKGMPDYLKGIFSKDNGGRSCFVIFLNIDLEVIFSCIGKTHF